MSLVYEHLLKKISPIWYKVLTQIEEEYGEFNFHNWPKYRFHQNNREYNLTQQRCCIVGEAHEFNTYYEKCEKCHDFAFSIFEVENWKEFWEDRQMFAEHFIEEHPK